MNYAKIVPCDIANGEGVRVTLFVQGCDHHCPGCQNPTTWDPNGGKPFTDETLDKIVDLLRPDYIQKMFGSGLDTSGKNYGIRMESYLTFLLTSTFL